MLLKNIIKNTFTKEIHKRNICFYKRCPEEENFFSTTFKVNFFTILSTGFINSLIISHNQSVNEQFNQLNEKINKK